jgi:hypothetical protein
MRVIKRLSFMYGFRLSAVLGVCSVLPIERTGSTLLSTCMGDIRLDKTLDGARPLLLQQSVEFPGNTVQDTINLSYGYL